MDDDYLNVRFKEAEEKLRKAIKECDKGCDAKQKGSIYMHLGIILVNAGKKDDAVGAFSSGLKEDSGAAPEKDFTSPDVQKAYDEAKAKGGKAGGDDKPPPTDKPEPQSDLKHEAITEGLVNAPLPVFVGADASAAKFVLNYKPFGGEWTKAEMKRMGKGYGAEIPCKDTSATGTLKYYIVAQDAGGDAVASAGTKKQPYEVAIKNKVSGDPPSFPGKEPPAQCKSKDQCPPGINEPGCEASASLGFGSKCTGPGQCNKADGLACIEGTCQAGAEEGSGTEGAGDGTGDDAPPKKNWFSLSLVLDDALVGGGEVCTAQNYSDGTYACFKNDGSLYKTYATLPKGGTPDHGTVSGPPFAVGTIRALVGYDRLIVSNLLLGIRLGYAFNGGPAVPSSSGDKAFLPFHIEPRATYFIGAKNVLSKTGVRPYVFLGGGVGQVDAKIAGVPVQNEISATNANGTGKTQVDAWRKMGTSFVAVGGGIVYAVSKKTGVSVDIKVSQFFGSSGTAVSPSLGFVQGF